MEKLTAEDRVKKIAAAIREELEVNKQEYDEEKLTKMVQAQIAAQEESEQKALGRQSGSFDETDPDPEVNEAEFKDINGLTEKKRFHHQEVKMLTGMKRLERVHGDSLGSKIEEFKDLQDEAYMVSIMLHAGQEKSLGRAVPFMDVYRSTDAYKQVHNILSKDVDLRKALAVATAGSGAEWIPTGFSSQVLTTIELQLKVAALFNSISMPTNPYKLPVQTGNAEGYLIPESTADEATKITASTPATSSPSFTARKLAGRVLFSEEIDEDSIVNIRSFTTSELAKAIARAQETAIVNGDRETAAGVASAHQDNAGTALFSSNRDPRLAFDGLRFFALNQTDTSTKAFANADPSDALMASTRVLMGKHGVNPNDLVIISSISTYLKAITMTNVVTLEKYGAQASVLTGELMKHNGIPWVVSEYLYSNINDLGKYDGSTTDRSMVLMVYRPGFIIGNRGGVTLGTEVDIETDQIKLVAKRRTDFVDPYDATATGNVQCVAGINVKTT